MIDTVGKNLAVVWGLIGGGPTVSVADGEKVDIETAVVIPLAVGIAVVIALVFDLHPDLIPGAMVCAEPKSSHAHEHAADRNNASIRLNIELLSSPFRYVM